MPEQEFLPPRPSARSYRPDRDDEDPPPWANLPPVRPARPRRPAGGGHPAGPGRPAGGGRPGSPSGPGVPVGPGNGPGPWPRRLTAPAALVPVLRVLAGVAVLTAVPVVLVALVPVLRVLAAVSVALAVLAGMAVRVLAVRGGGPVAGPRRPRRRVMAARAAMAG